MHRHMGQDVETTMPLNPPSNDFLTKLDAAVPGVLSDPTPAYLEEPRGFYLGQAAALARPRSVEDVSKIVAMANEARVGLIPYSGGTGLVGGQVKPDGVPCVILSLERMNAVRELVPEDMSVVVEAGTILADVHNAAEEHDLLFPLSLASEGSCRIGGNLSTNAGGVNVLRWGNARDLCLGVEAVLADGTIMRGLKSLRKDNTGYDMRHLLVGAEGTLGVITAARLRLFPQPKDIVTGLLNVPSPTAALVILRRLQAEFNEMISAFELIHRTGIDFVEETMPDQPLPPTGDSEWLVLVELGSGTNASLETRANAALEALFEEGLVLDGSLAQSASQRATIWGLRESIPLANRNVGGIASHDISVPISRIPEFIEEAAAMFDAWSDDFRINCFGHMGDGNLHYNVYPPKGRSKKEYANQKDAIVRAVHDLAAAYDGSISAEHGIGRVKRDDLVKYGDPGKLAAMAAIKTALDPNGILNPGAVIDPLGQ